MNRKIQDIRLILVVVSVLCVSACSSRHRIPDEYNREADNINGLLLRSHIYFSREGFVPKSIESILNYPIEEQCIEKIQISGLRSNDVWNTMLRYESKHNKVVIQSAGKDRVWGTSDDLQGTVKLESERFISMECKYLDTGSYMIISID